MMMSMFLGYMKSFTLSIKFCRGSPNMGFPVTGYIKTGFMVGRAVVQYNQRLYWLLNCRCSVIRYTGGTLYILLDYFETKIISSKITKPILFSVNVIVDHETKEHPLLSLKVKVKKQHQK